MTLITTNIITGHGLHPPYSIVATAFTIDRFRRCMLFNTVGHRSLSSLGGLNEAKRVFNKNVTPIKILVEKIGNPSKLMLQQKNYFLYDDSNIINHFFCISKEGPK